jgi:hypothetical protein
MYNYDNTCYISIFVALLPLLFRLLLRQVSVLLA